MDEDTKKYWAERILGRIVGTYKIKRYIFNRSDIPFEKCELCGKRAELLPVGPNDEWVCDECGRHDPIIRKQKFDRIVKLREAKYESARSEHGKTIKAAHEKIGYSSAKTAQLFYKRKRGD